MFDTPWYDEEEGENVGLPSSVTNMPWRSFEFCVVGTIEGLANYLCQHRLSCKKRAVLTHHIAPSGDNGMAVN
jgi:hypothetical protein